MVTGKGCAVGCADAGYADTEELEKIDRRGTKVIVSSQRPVCTGRQALHNPEEKPFRKSNCIYDKEHDCYSCPGGQKLIYEGKQEGDKEVAYRITDAGICK